MTGTSDTYSISSGNLSKASFPASAGNRLSFGNGNAVAVAPVTSQTSGSVFYSYLVSVESVSNFSAPTYLTGLQQSGSVIGAPVWIRDNGLGFDFGISHRQGSTDAIFTTGAKTIQTTYLIVASYTFNGSAKDDVVRLWVDPSSSSFGGTAPAATLTYTNSSAFLNDLTSISAFQIQQNSTNPTPTVILDEIRVGTSWADVTSVPEPATIFPFAVAGLLLNRRRIRS